MTAADASCIRALTALVLLAGVGCAAASMGCVSGSNTDAPTADLDRNPNELTCELALLHFEQLIDARSSEEAFSPAALIEAREIYQISRQLYLEREYQLALQLIEEGMLLVE